MYAGQTYMSKCAFTEENVDSRKLTNKLGKAISPCKEPVRLDRRRVTSKNFKGKLDLGWLTVR